MFDFLKKKPSLKSSIKLTHKNGEVIEISVEGSNAVQVEYVSSRIRQIFNMPSGHDFPFTKEELDKASKDINEAFDQMGDTFDQLGKVFDSFGKHNKK